MHTEHSYKSIKALFLPGWNLSPVVAAGLPGSALLQPCGNGEGSPEDCSQWVCSHDEHRSGLEPWALSTALSDQLSGLQGHFVFSLINWLNQLKGLCLYWLRSYLVKNAHPFPHEILLPWKTGNFPTDFRQSTSCLAKKNLILSSNPDNSILHPVFNFYLYFPQHFILLSLFFPVPATVFRGNPFISMFVRLTGLITSSQKWWRKTTCSLFTLMGVMTLSSWQEQTKGLYKAMMTIALVNYEQSLQTGNWQLKDSLSAKGIY